MIEWKKKIVDYNFTYHKPNETQQPRYEQIRSKAKELANLILEVTPDSFEQEASITFLETATFWANAAIARENRNGELFD